MALKNCPYETLTLQNSKFETELDYNSSSVSIALTKYIYRKSDDKYISTGRIDFITAEAVSLFNLFVLSSNTAKSLEYLYPSNNIKFSTSVSNNYITVTKYIFNKVRNTWYEKNSIKIHINEMPGVILILYRALIHSTTINWQAIEPTVPPKPLSPSDKAFVDKLLEGMKK